MSKDELIEAYEKGKNVKYACFITVNDPAATGYNIGHEQLVWKTLKKGEWNIKGDFIMFNGKIMAIDKISRYFELDK